MAKLSPQQGPQEMFLRSSAEIAIYGGAAGGGKTYALLLDLLRYKNVPGFKGIVFRKEYTQITNPGGLIDESMEIYNAIPGAVLYKSPKYHWNFDRNATLSFDYMAREKDKYRFQGAQICMIAFDELTHFSEGMFFYMLSRNRSTCGVKPYIRATCNPDPDSWVADFISWWLDPETGYPIPERSGKVRFFLRIEEKVYWSSSRRQLIEEHGAALVAEHGEKKALSMCKSATFISSSIYDNKKLLAKDPGYLANLNGLSLVEKERLLKGNWKIRPAAGLYFKREQARMVRSIPDKIVMIARAWDLAATEITANNRNPDRTAGALVGRLKNGQYIILNVIRQARGAAGVRQLVKNTAVADNALFKCNKIILPQDPGQAGKEQAESYVRELAGFRVVSHPVTGSKIKRAEPLAAQWQQGNVLVVEADWNAEFFTELEGFPDALHDDQVDAVSDAFNAVAAANNYSALPINTMGEYSSYWNQ